MSGLINFNNVNIVDGFTIGGKKELDGNYGKYFDVIFKDDKCGQKTFEKAEKTMFETCLHGLLAKTSISTSEIDTIIGGDLLNQIVSSTFAARELGTQFLGIYNACATFVESLIIGGMLIDGGYNTNCICFSGSHFSTAERQYRYPLELGVLRSPVSQWTATGVGSTLISNQLNPIAHLSRACIGKVVDFGINDVNNMGAAMAPAAADTLVKFFTLSQTKPSDFDLIATGDLGYLGGKIFLDLMMQEGFNFCDNYIDCGANMYVKSQQTFMGASGAACSALVFNSVILSGVKTKKYSRVLLLGTGALMSPLTSFQGESIPSIAHCVEVVGV